MTVISTKSITGVTSITSPQSDNAVTLHTNDTTQRVSVTTGGMNVTGVVTATSFSGSIAATNIDSGTVATARLGSGTANSSSFLRGDQTWASNTSTTINSNAANRVILGSGTADTLNAQSNFTYDGDEIAIYAQTDDTDCILHLVGKTASGGVGQAGRTAIIAESTHNSNGQSAMHLRTRNTSNAQLIAMTLDGNQNVGIGTQLPHNNAGTNVQIHSTNTTSEIRFTNSTTGGGNNGGTIQMGGNTLYISNSENGNTVFENNGGEKLRIASDGLVKWAGHTLSARNSATGVAGGMIYNSEGKVFQYHDGSGWITLNTTNQIVATGGNTVSTSNGYRIHDFVGSSTFEITSGFGEVEVLVVAGGGSEGGGNSGCHGGGGGGGGGVVYQKINLYAGKYTVTVGAGGLWRNNGENSVFGAGTDNTITALGGGAGGPTLDGNGNSGGSGGGGSRHTTTNQGGATSQPASADGGFGNVGGNTGSNTSPGGGGGAAGIGTDGSSGGLGGAGKQFTQFGLNTYFGAGGNGNSTGGSAGQTQGSNNGAANTGAGGGGSPGTGTRYQGGSGRVMIRYPAAS